MNRALRHSLCALVGAAALASCGGGGGAPGLPFHAVASPTASASGAPGTAQITIKIVIPASTAAKYRLRTFAKTVRPNYVSLSTASVKITVNGQSSSAVILNISCQSFPCTEQTTLSAPTNQQDTFAVIGYDAANAGGNALEDGSVTQFVPVGLTTIPISLGGVVEGFNSVNICPPATPACGESYQVSTASETSWTISVNQATDYDGNIIVGNYDVPIVLVENEADITQNEFDLNPTSLTSSSSTAELTYKGTFDGENAPSISIMPESCNSNGTPQTLCKTPGTGNYEVSNLYAVLETPCQSGTPACSTYGFYGSPLMGAYGNGLAQVNGTVYADDNYTVFDTVSPVGIPLETPANAFLLINQQGGASSSLVPPLSLSDAAGSNDVAAVGSTLYFDDATYGDNDASYSPSSGHYAEYANDVLTNGPGGGGAAGADGNYYEGEYGNSTQFLAQFNPSTQKLQEYTLLSGHTEQWITSLGSNIWFAAQDPNNSQYYLGYMADNNAGLTVPKTHETAVGSLSAGDYWQITHIAAAQSNVFFVAEDENQAESVVGDINPNTSAVSVYPLPSTWPANPDLTSIVYNPSDGYVYFTDSENGILGRVPSSNPSTSAIQGFGPKFNEKIGLMFSTMLADSSGRIWIDSIIPQNGNSIVNNDYGLTIITPSAATWSSSPSSGIPAIKRRIIVMKRKQRAVRHVRGLPF